MNFTFRLAHLKEIRVHTGDKIQRGSAIGAMGNTGQSTGDHGHIDVVNGTHDWVYRIHDMERGYPKPNFEELQFFIDKELCGGSPFHVTTYPYDYRYIIRGQWKPHPGYDIVIVDEHPVFYWNRSYEGTVIASGYDDGYGNYVQIEYTK